MLRFLANYSIGKKLILLVSATAGLSVIIVLLISSVNDVISARTTADKQLNILAEVIALNSASAIIFNDTAGAYETLSALQVNNSVLRADVLDNQNKVFSTYVNVNHFNAGVGEISSRSGGCDY